MSALSTRAREHGETPARSEKPATSPARAAAMPDNKQALPGNLALQALYAAGALRARHVVGAADDPSEAEADRMAAAAMAGKPAGCSCGPGAPPCPRCRAAQAMIRRKPRGGETPSGAENISLGPERGLGSGEREFFESRYRADLSGVRIHDNPDAAASAAQLDARAFALGSRIAFARGEYQPHTDQGRQLLGHELAHIVLGHGGIRRDAGGAGAPTGKDDKAAALPADFDPCAVDVAKLDNTTLLNYYAQAEKYINGLLAAKKKGEERFYDYGNLLDRLSGERSTRARAGHVWLKANVTAVPGTLYRLEAAAPGDVISVSPADKAAAGSNAPVGNGIVVTDDQFQKLLADKQIPTVDPAEFFARQDPNKPVDPLKLKVPQQKPPSPSPFLDPNDPFGLQAQSPYPGFNAAGGPPFSGLGPWGNAVGIGAGYGLSPTSAFQFGPFARPVVTAGPFGYAPDQVEGFRTDWRGDFGEARFLSQTDASLRTLQDVNTIQQNFPLYDVYDPSTGQFISIKTQLPPAVNGDPSLASTQDAWRELFGKQAPAKRTDALNLLQGNIDNTLTQDQMLLRTRIAVNPENVTLAQDSLEAAIRRGQADYEPLLSALLRQQPIQVTMKDKSIKTYSDFTSLHADFSADPRPMSEKAYRDAIAALAQRARGQIISNGSNAESDLRPRLDYRQRYDFSGASDFAGTADTPLAKQQARALQEQYFRKIGVPELYDVQTGGYGPVVKSAAGTGAALGVGTTAVLQLPQTVSNWDKDPYAGRRYLTNVALGGIGGTGQAAADQAWRVYISQKGLDWAASRALAGQSVSPVASLTPLARFGGSTALGGVAAGGITVGGMYLDESFFGADYSTIDYTAKGTRAFVSGSFAAGAGALATAGTTAWLAGGSGAAGCTVILPGVGTVACGAVGAVGGFIVGLGAYYLFDYAVGDKIEGGVREAMGEKGCTGNKPATTTTKPEPPEPRTIGCFEADTPVTLADGSTRRIADIAIGDLVLSYHERGQRLETRPVSAVHQFPPDLMLALRLADGSRTKVTVAHKLRGPRGWIAAGDLRAGDELWIADATSAPPVLRTVKLEGVASVAAEGAVYDLSVERTHTYFAGAILAHNKAF